MLARWQFELLSLRYDLARAQVVASQKVVLQMDQIHKGADGWQPDVRNTYLSYERSAKEAIEDIRSSLPEVAHAIELRLARRIRLNLELDGYHAQRRSGAMEAGVAQTCIAEVETRMKELLHAPQRESLPETADLVCHLPLFQNLDDKELKELALATEEMAFSPGEVLIKEGDESDCMYIIARGAAHVVKHSRGQDILLDTLGGGDIVGETALLTGEPRNATVVAVTTVTVGRVNQTDFERIMSGSPGLRASVWSTFASHRFHNLVRRDWRFSHLSHESAADWLRSSIALGDLQPGEVAAPIFPETEEPASYLFLASGSLDISGSKRSAPALLRVEEHKVYRVVEPTYALCLGPEPTAQEALDVAAARPSERQAG